MDGSLSSSRYGPADRGGGFDGGGDRDNHRGRHHGGGGRRGHGGRHNNYRHQPYNNNNSNNNNNNNSRRGGRGGGLPSNRFTKTTSVDPATAVQRQLAAMVSRVGELKDPPPEFVATENQQRPVMQAVAKNIQDLATVLCAPTNAPLFLKFDKADEGAGKLPTPTEAAGLLVALVVNCAATLPLQTPAYVGLTLAVEQGAPQPEYGGFAQRCVDYSMLVLSQQLDDPNALSQVQHLLRYICMLGKTNIVVGYEADDVGSEAPTTAFGLLCQLTRAATQSVLLRHAVLSSVPYIVDYVPSDVIAAYILNPLDEISYQSAFAPGIGTHSLLLKKEQLEEGLKDEDDDDEEDDEDDDDDDDASGQVCDTMQDLMRCIKSMVLQGQRETRFSLLTDAPWTSIMGEPLCRLPPLVLKESNEVLEPSVYGRLPIFGSPPGDDDDDDLEENKNERLQAYEKSFSLLDRYFLADAIRNCLIQHQITVSDTGVTRGSAKDTAQQLWSVCHIVLQMDGAVTGIEYIMVETLLSFILQSSPHSRLSPLYVSRILLEMVRAQPADMPQALAVGVHNLFEFYLPSLAPWCRDNLSCWFSFHLTNTDYQWPKAYWDHWARYVPISRNSRGDFVTYALELMLENLSSAGTMVSTCLPPGSALATSLNLLQEEATEFIPNDFLIKFESDIKERIWERNEDPDLVESFVREIELTESTDTPPWWRSRITLRVLLDLIEKHRQGQIKQITDSLTEDSMDSEQEDSNINVLDATTEAIARYQGGIRAALQQDLQDQISNGEATSEADLLTMGGVHLLGSLYKVTSKSAGILEGCLQSLLLFDLVNTKSVVSWLLGRDQPRHWWKLAVTAFQMGLKEVKKKVSEDTVMLVDNTGDDSAEMTYKIAAVREFTVPFIQGAVNQVCHRLDGGDINAKKFTPVEVDLVEGLKRFLVETRILVRVALSSIHGSNPIKNTRISVLLSEFEITGEALASQCRQSGTASNGLELLVAVLEGM